MIFLIFEIGLNSFYILTLPGTNKGQGLGCGGLDDNDSLRFVLGYIVSHWCYYLGKIRRHVLIEEVGNRVSGVLLKVLSFPGVLSLSPS